MDRMRKALLTFTLLFAAAACGDGVAPDQATDQTVFAVVSWTEDVAPISLGELGIAGEDLQNHGTYALTQGLARASWTSAGTQYSQSLSIGSSDSEADQDVQCEQEGEHEGDNEGCTFAFVFSGASLSITMVN